LQLLHGLLSERHKSILAKLMANNFLPIPSLPENI